VLEKISMNTECVDFWDSTEGIEKVWIKTNIDKTVKTAYGRKFEILPRLQSALPSIKVIPVKSAHTEKLDPVSPKYSETLNGA